MIKEDKVNALGLKVRGEIEDEDCRLSLRIMLPSSINLMKKN